MTAAGGPRRAILIGAGSAPGRGMGQAIAVGLAAAGDRVVAADVDPDRAADSAARVREQGRRRCPWR